MSKQRKPWLALPVGCLLAPPLLDWRSRSSSTGMYSVTIRRPSAAAPASARTDFAPKSRWPITSGCPGNAAACFKNATPSPVSPRAMMASTEAALTLSSCAPKSRSSGFHVSRTSGASLLSWTRLRRVYSLRSQRCKHQQHGWVPRLTPRSGRTTVSRRWVESRDLESPKAATIYSRRCAMATYKLISADSHIVEPPDLYASRIELRFRDRAPRMERMETPTGRKYDAWFIDGLQVGTLGAVMQAGQRFEDPSQIDFLGVWEDVRIAAYDPQAMIKENRSEERRVGKGV